MKKISIPLNAENQLYFQAVAGKNIKITISGTSICLFLNITAESLCLSNEECVYQLEIIGAPFSLLRVLLRAKQAEASWNNITLHGDVLFAEALSKALRRANLDWESLLAQYLGDFPAVQLVLFGQRSANWSRQTARELLQNISEYWQEEARHTPSPIEITEFVTAVDTLQDDYARLEARVQRLIKAVN